MAATRRELLKATAVIGLASHLPGVLAEEKPTVDKGLPIIDTHQHLWDLTKFRLPWLKSEQALDRSYVTKDYLTAVAGLNVVQAVYMEVDVEPSQQVLEADHILSLTKDPKNLTVAAVISGRPASAEFKPYIMRYKDVARIKGVRQVLHGPETKAGYCLQDSFVASVRLLGEMNKSFDICMRPTELADAVKLAERCPDTRLIVDHCGNADPVAFAKVRAKDAPAPEHDPEDWKRQIAALAKKPNTICKISGIVARATKGSWKSSDLAPIVNHCLDEFGPDRVVFGSDWPVCTLAASLREWVVALREIIAARPESDQRKLLADNARRYYRLD